MSMTDLMRSICSDPKQIDMLDLLDDLPEALMWLKRDHSFYHAAVIEQYDIATKDDFLFSSIEERYTRGDPDINIMKDLGVGRLRSYYINTVIYDKCALYFR